MKTGRRYKGAGFTLVEVLIALIVLSIGLLGIAAMYVETLRANRSALVRTQAIALASDLADRIRSNRVPANNYTGSGVNAQAIADLAAWNDQVVDQLPGGDGTVLFRAGTATTPALYMIQVSWTEVGQEDPSTYELRLEI
ncbi:MAG TPA: type IV pilus modification protein PilV [Steroidobacteraceae bacterium]|nr:type IV pilus modification protein PilV [Steroidobacteraceae bacterium]